MCKYTQWTSPHLLFLTRATHMAAREDVVSPRLRARCSRNRSERCQGARLRRFGPPRSPRRRGLRSGGRTAWAVPLCQPHHLGCWRLWACLLAAHSLNRWERSPRALRGPVSPGRDRPALRRRVGRRRAREPFGSLLACHPWKGVGVCGLAGWRPTVTLARSQRREW